MIDPETRARVEKLKEAGLGSRTIARKLGISRNSVREILEPARRERRRAKRQQNDPPSPSVLKPYKLHVEAILEKDERIRKANPRTKPITTRLILKQIRKLGYSGGRTILDEKGELIAKHQLSEEKGRLVVDEEHYAELRKRKGRASIPDLERQFLERFGAHKGFLDELSFPPSTMTVWGAASIDFSRPIAQDSF